MGEADSKQVLIFNTAEGDKGHGKKIKRARGGEFWGSVGLLFCRVVGKGLLERKETSNQTL